MGSDAQWLAENVILPRLDALDKKLESRDKATQHREEKMWDAIEEGKRCANKTKVKVAKLEANKDALQKHLDDKDAHFDKVKAEQTNLGYLAKKKVLLIFVTALSVIVTAATGLLVAWLNGLFGA